MANVTIKSYSTATSSFSVTEAQENFAVDGSYNGVSTLAYDNNGNLTYDGLQSYTYDAWNRLKTVSHAYRIAVADGGDGNVHSGQVFDTLSYDAAGRRILKAINGTGSMDCTLNDYYSGQSMIEERNGSNQSIKDRVWGLTYIDEAVQTRVNTNPTGTASWTSYWLCQDSNFNVLGMANSSGTLTERYEYSAYGQRQVFVSSGSNDPGCYTPSSMSTRVVATGSVIEPWGISDNGHQGLMHDEEDGLVYDRARMLNPVLGSFMQEEPYGAGYIDGTNLYKPFADAPTVIIDPFGFAGALPPSPPPIVQPVNPEPVNPPGGYGTAPGVPGFPVPQSPGVPVELAPVAPVEAGAGGGVMSTIGEFLGSTVGQGVIGIGAILTLTEPNPGGGAGDSLPLPPWPLPPNPPKTDCPDPCGDPPPIPGGPLENNHVFPRALGGGDGPTVPIDFNQHRGAGGSFHNDLNDWLGRYQDGKGNNMRPRNGNSGRDVRRNFSPDEIKNALDDFYNGPCGEKWPNERDAYQNWRAQDAANPNQY